MKSIFVTLLLLVSGNANAVSTIFILDSSSNKVLETLMLPSQTSYYTTYAISHGDLKVIQAAQEDAANFLATEGEVRTPMLTNAFNILRKAAPSATQSDLEIAQVVLQF